MSLDIHTASCCSSAVKFPRSYHFLSTVRISTIVAREYNGTDILILHEMPIDTCVERPCSDIELNNEFAFRQEILVLNPWSLV